MELRQLRYFLAVAQELHFGRAAQKVHIAQSPLSRQIKSLEESLGVELFYRNKHHVELTEAGKAFVTQAQAILQQTEQARRVAKNAAEGMTGRITIGYTTSAIYTAFPHILVQYKRRYPQVEIVLHDNLLTPIQIEGLANKQLDLGFLRPPVGKASIGTLVIARQHLVLACSVSHRCATEDSVDLAEFANEPFVMFSHRLDSALVTIMRRVCHEAGFLPRVVQEVGDFPTMMSLVAHGMGVALVPSSAGYMHFRNVVLKKIRGVKEELSMAMAWNMEMESPTRDSFIHLVQQELVDDTGGLAADIQAKAI